MSDVLTNEAPARSRMRWDFRAVGGLLLLLCLSALFLFSAYSKTRSILSFEWDFIDMGLRNQLAAAIAARFVIGFEAFLGLMLLFHVLLRRFTYPAIIWFLAVMCGYLVYLIVLRGGNSGTCDCFGTAVQMSPGAAIAKNLVMIAAVWLLRRWYAPSLLPRPDIVMPVLAVAGMTAAFLINPVGTRKPVSVNLEPLYTVNPVKPDRELRKGKQIVAFLSLTCPHCKKAAIELVKLRQENPALPVYMVLAGPPMQEGIFFNETKSRSVPHVLWKPTDGYSKMTGKSYVPVIYLVNNGRAERELFYPELNGAELKRWTERP